MDEDVRQKLSVEIVKHYARNGQVCKLGWTAFQAGMSGSQTPVDAANFQLVKDAFYMGIQHTFSSLMQTIGEGEEDGDIAVMNSIGVELQLFLKDFLSRNGIFAQTNKADLSSLMKDLPEQ